MSIALERPVPTYPAPGESSTYEVTYDEFMAMPVTKQHVEVVDGVIYVMAGPTIYHQVAQDRFGDELRPAVRRADLGLVVSAPLDVVICERPKLRVRQPDLAYFSNARAGCRVSERLDLIQDGILKPSLVVDVLSPGQNERTLADKLADYASIEVEEVWFADQETRSIRVLAREGDRYRLAGEFRPGERLVSAVLPGIDLDVAAIFGIS